jgi:hypothetical protein
MLTTFAAAIALSSANTKLALGALLALSEVLGADPRVKANGILSFILIQAQNFIKSKESK